MTVLLAGMLMGCSDPMYPTPKLPPIVLPADVPPPPVDRLLMTVLLPTSMSKDKDRPRLGRVPTKSKFNVQWISLPENRQRDGKQDDAHFANMAYFLTVFLPRADGKELVSRLVAQPPERDIETDGRWSYRLPLTAPDEPGSYVVRLHTDEATVSESILEVISGVKNER